MKLHLISDFNLETLGHYLVNGTSPPPLAVSFAPFGQVVPSLLEGPHGEGVDFALVWTLPEKVVPAFGDALNGLAVDEDRLLAEVHQFADCVLQAQKHFRSVFVVSWTLPLHQRGNGILNLKRQGLRRFLLKMNLKLAEELDNASGVYLLDGERWMAMVGKNAYSPKLWYLTKTPFHAEVFRRAAGEVRSAISALLGESKKLVIVDLDDTLWGGVVGDLGWQNLRLGGHDYLGEAYRDFQKALKSLRNRGVLLAIASKNEEAVALEALAKHPEMVLRLEDFAAYRINWNDKAVNVAELVAEMNLGLQSVVFIDDNPVERARVREALPEVYVPEWPDDKTLFASQLLELDCFDSPCVTAEDVARHQMYATERLRELSRKQISSPQEWLRSLETEITVEELGDANRVRVVQLMNKTNQMNLATRRVSEQELQNWLQQGNRKLWVFRVKDKFGDSGLTGILSLEIEAETARITDFVLSCRVMERNVERAMVAYAARYCAGLTLTRLQAEYLPTAKNKPCLKFWKASGFSLDGNGTRFTWCLNQPYPFPEGIKVLQPQEKNAATTLSSNDGLRDPEVVSPPVFTD